MYRLARDFNGCSTQKEMKEVGNVYAVNSYPRYWDLTEYVDGHVGTFRITSDGYRFLAGDLLIHKTIWRFDSEEVDREGPMVSAADILGQKYDTYESVRERIVSDRRFATKETRRSNVRRKVVRTPRESKEPPPSVPPSQRREGTSRARPAPKPEDPLPKSLVRKYEKPKRSKASSEAKKAKSADWNRRLQQAREEQAEKKARAREERRHS